MKKLLCSLSIMTMSTITASSLVSCNPTSSNLEDYVDVIATDIIAVDTSEVSMANAYSSATASIVLTWLEPGANKAAPNLDWPVNNADQIKEDFDLAIEAAINGVVANSFVDAADLDPSDKNYDADDVSYVVSIDDVNTSDATNFLNKLTALQTEWATWLADPDATSIAPTHALRFDLTSIKDDKNENWEGSASFSLKVQYSL